jgi:hypothetical protein
MSRIIKCQVNDEYLLGSGVVIGAAGSYGDVILRLKFNEMWDGLAIMATFRDALNQNPKVVMLVPSMLVDGEVRTYEVYIPAEAKQIAGRVRLTLTGYSTYTVNDDGSITTFKDSLTNTSTAFFRVLESDAALLDDGSIGDHPTPTLAEQALAAINEASRILGEADDRLNETDMKLGEFDDAETARSSAESERVSAESERVSAESERVSAESERVSAETARIIKENARINAETSRVNAEAARAEAETSRQEAETARHNAEAERAAAETYREKKMEQLKNLVGDIDTALDAILDIQNSLIGGDYNAND